ncbi:MAG: non-canonical purine NTP pyrophosphatase [bacterium]
MKTILFATTNKNKVARIKNFMKGEDVKILSLEDLDYKIEEPEEKGNTPVEIAKNKARYYYDNLKEKYIVMSQDETIQFFNIPELSKPILSIKKPVIYKYGEFSDQKAIELYSDLAKKHKGKIDMQFNYGFAICDGNKLIGKKATLKCTLVSEICNKILPGYFLASIIKLDMNGKQKYYIEMSDKELISADKDLFRAVKLLLDEIG